jgi:hypothetical protein
VRLARVPPARAPACFFILPPTHAIPLPLLLASCPAPLSAGPPTQVVVAALQQLVAFCRSYAEAAEAQGSPGTGTGGPGTALPAGGLQRSLSSGAGLSAEAAAQHQVFYASMQAALYILCYHMRSLVSDATAEGAPCAQATRRLVQVGGARKRKREGERLRPRMATQPVDFL